MKTVAINTGNVRQNRKSVTPLFLVRIFTYEYWPFQILFFPVFFYWIFLSLKSRSLTWFTAANPGIKYGGVFGESKSQILDLIPEQYKPASLYIKKSINADEVLSQMQQSGISFPVIAKPDKGEMGFFVEKIRNFSQLESYCMRSPSDFLIQEFITWEKELGILYIKMPGSSCGRITSVTAKEFLSVTGDGFSSLAELMQQSIRARFQIKRLSGETDLSKIPSAGERVLLEPIGNHCRGTRFIDARHLVNDELVMMFDNITAGMNGFYYGRFDLKTPSYDSLSKGMIKIMEVNGVTSEPAHIYDSGMNLFKAWKVILKHVKYIYIISMANHSAGIKYVSAQTLIKQVRSHFQYKSRI